MTVCKFFQQGSCRYGQNCRFDHMYGSKYSYHSNATQQQSGSTPAVTDEQLVNQVHSDVQAALRGGQWLLSCYAPFKEKPPFPGLSDLSPEEARLLIYEARESNNLDQVVAYVNNLFKDARTKYEQLLAKNSNITKVFRSLYKGENVSSPFVAQESSQFASNTGTNAASSIFRSAIQTSPFGQPSGQSVFGQSNQPSIFAQNTPSVFQNATNSDPAQSIFAQASQNTFGSQSSNLFGAQSPTNANTNSQGMFGQVDSAKSLFAQATQSVFSPDVNAPSPSALFASAAQSQTNLSPFGQNPSENVFQKSEAQTFGNQNVFQQNKTQQSPTDMNIYSKMEDLSPEEIEAYKSDDFKLGFVPELPPPQMFCV